MTERTQMVMETIKGLALAFVLIAASMWLYFHWDHLANWIVAAEIQEDEGTLQTQLSDALDIHTVKGPKVVLRPDGIVEFRPDYRPSAGERWQWYAASRQLMAQKKMQDFDKWLRPYCAMVDLCTAEPPVNYGRY